MLRTLLISPSSSLYPSFLCHIPLFSVVSLTSLLYSPLLVVVQVRHTSNQSDMDIPMPTPGGGYPHPSGPPLSRNIALPMSTRLHGMDMGGGLGSGHVLNVGELLPGGIERALQSRGYTSYHPLLAISVEDGYQMYPLTVPRMGSMYGSGGGILSHDQRYMRGPMTGERLMGSVASGGFTNNHHRNLALHAMYSSPSFSGPGLGLGPGSASASGPGLTPIVLDLSMDPTSHHGTGLAQAQAQGLALARGFLSEWNMGTPALGQGLGQGLGQAMTMEQANPRPATITERQRLLDTQRSAFLNANSFSSSLADATAPSSSSSTTMMQVNITYYQNIPSYYPIR